MSVCSQAEAICGIAVSDSQSIAGTDKGVVRGDGKRSVGVLAGSSYQNGGVMLDALVIARKCIYVRLTPQNASWEGQLFVDGERCNTAMDAFVPLTGSGPGLVRLHGGIWIECAVEWRIPEKGNDRD